MNISIRKHQHCYFVKAISISLIICFSLLSVVPTEALAQGMVSAVAINPMSPLSPVFTPTLVRGIRVYPDNPFQFDFIVDSGDTGLKGEDLKQESERLIRYFLASLTVPEDDLWVNLSPYESDRIVPDELGKTEMGIDMLAQDYLLKQITASLTNPESDIGKEFWQKIYSQAYEQYGTIRHLKDGETSSNLQGEFDWANFTVDTFNKVWIMPDKAEVYVQEDKAFIVESRLKVMLEEDYLAREEGLKDQRNRGIEDVPILPAGSQSKRDNAQKSKLQDPDTFQVRDKFAQADLMSADGLHKSGAHLKTNEPRAKSQELTSQIVREIILPELEREVNEGKNFAQLRQIYHSLILAHWYKTALKDSILNKVYSDQKKIEGLKGQRITGVTEGVKAQVSSGTERQNNLTPNTSNMTQSDPSNPLILKSSNPLSEVQQIYSQYLNTFKQGVHNMIKVEYDPYTQKHIPRKYFAGGVTAIKISSVMTTTENPYKLVQQFNDNAQATGQPTSYVATVAMADSFAEPTASSTMGDQNYSKKMKEAAEISQGISSEILPSIDIPNQAAFNISSQYDKGVLYLKLAKGLITPEQYYEKLSEVVDPITQVMFDLGDQVARQVINDFYKLGKEIDVDLLPLLAEPGISTRSNNFLDFVKKKYSKNDSGINARTIRKDYSDFLGFEKVYRSVRLNENPDNNEVLLPKIIRNILNNLSIDEVTAFREGKDEDRLLADLLVQEKMSESNQGGEIVSLMGIDNLYSLQRDINTRVFMYKEGVNIVQSVTRLEQLAKDFIMKGFRQDLGTAYIFEINIPKIYLIDWSEEYLPRRKDLPRFNGNIELSNGEVYDMADPEVEAFVQVSLDPRWIKSIRKLDETTKTYGPAVSSKRRETNQFQVVSSNISKKSDHGESASFANKHINRYQEIIDYYKKDDTDFPLMIMVNESNSFGINFLSGTINPGFPLPGGFKFGKLTYLGLGTSQGKDPLRAVGIKKFSENNEIFVQFIGYRQKKNSGSNELEIDRTSIIKIFDDGSWTFVPLLSVAQFVDEIEKKIPKIVDLPAEDSDMLQSVFFKIFDKEDPQIIPITRFKNRWRDMFNLLNREIEEHNVKVPERRRLPTFWRESERQVNNALINNVEDDSKIFLSIDGEKLNFFVFNQRNEEILKIEAKIEYNTEDQLYWDIVRSDRKKTRSHQVKISQPIIVNEKELSLIIDKIYNRSSKGKETIIDPFIFQNEIKILFPHSANLSEFLVYSEIVDDPRGRQAIRINLMASENDDDVNVTFLKVNDQWVMREKVVEKKFVDDLIKNLKKLIPQGSHHTSMLMNYSDYEAIDFAALINQESLMQKHNTHDFEPLRMFERLRFKTASHVKISFKKGKRGGLEEIRFQFYKFDPVEGLIKLSQERIYDRSGEKRRWVIQKDNIKQDSPSLKRNKPVKALADQGVILLSQRINEMKQFKNMILVAISGKSGTGQAQFSRDLARKVPNAVVLSVDSFIDAKTTRFDKDAFEHEMREKLFLDKIIIFEGFEPAQLRNMLLSCKGISHYFNPNKFFDLSVELIADLPTRIHNLSNEKEQMAHPIKDIPDSRNPQKFHWRDVDCIIDNSQISLSTLSQDRDLTPGGIDFNRSTMTIGVSGDDSSSLFNPDLFNIDPESIQGLIPVIIDIVPVVNFHQLLGLQGEDSFQVSKSL